MSLARKYRPQTLDEVVGQDVLVHTIKNSILHNRLPQAILLTGTRGVGKTTTARIIAKYLNCNTYYNQKCCNQCENCVDITNCHHVDVLEFDAASNTGVNDIRSIIETIQYVPLKSKYKFYIIDEVHMLSTSAFNALLKTLEEPPAHVRFVLATTEESKIPLTIISRCLQFKLLPISISNIEKQCAYILNIEQYTFDDEFVRIIAKNSNGSMRDALSILDGAIMFCQNEDRVLSSSKANDMLGHSSNCVNIYDDLCTGNIKSCLNEVKLLYNNGFDVATIVTNILNIIHNLTCEHVLHSNIAIDVRFLLKSWHVLNELLQNIKFTDNHIIQLEMTLIKLVYLRTDLVSFQDSNSISLNSDIMQNLIEQTSELLPTVQKMKLLNYKIKIDNIESYNHLRILLAFLLNINEAILYHKLSAVVKIVFLDLKQSLLIIDSTHEISKYINESLNLHTNSNWRVEIKQNANAMTYIEFLNMLDNEHHNAVLQTDIVKYIANEFDSLTVKKIKIN